jgi:hypothetical protein
VVKKRGAHIKHRAKAVPGIVAISSTKEYETHLRTSVIAFRGGWAEAAHWLDRVDTHDLVRIAFGLFAKPDASVTAVLDLAHVALENIRDRYEDTGRFGTTGDEYEALKLLAGVGGSLAGRLQMLDARRMEWTEIRLARNPDCPVCAAPRR